MVNDFTREPITIVEIDFEYCELESGVAPCTATQTGDAKCFNTFKSCNDTENYAAEMRTYRFCSDVSPLPANLEAFPFVESSTTTPAQIDLKGGLGFRASATVTFNDAPASDIGIDKYLDERSYIATERGTFWTKFRARNPFYVGRPLRIIKAYIVDGLVDYTDAITRHYIIEKIDATNGSCSITAKDPLKLANNRRAQAPLASRGQLSVDITASTTTVSIAPSGVGAEYPTSGFIKIRNEVMGFNRVGDSFAITRGQFNTMPSAHSEGDTLQLCLHYDGESIDTILEDLLVTYAGVDPDFIPSALWADEVGAFLPGLFTGLITDPTGVETLVKELGEQAPHHLYWDERTQTIQLRAVQPPPINAPTYTMESNLLEGSTRVSDQPDMRISTVIVYFGQFDPTRKIDESNNYQQIYVRTDADSIAQFGSNETKIVYSRWISNLNKAAAVRLAARIGRRFSSIPRSIEFTLDDKDRALWAGDTAAINFRDVVSFTGSPQTTQYQIISVQEADGYKYSGIEYSYGNRLEADDDFDDELTVRLGADVNNINMRDVFDSLFPEVPEDATVRFIIEQSVVVGSELPTSPAVLTGSWPTGTVLIYDNRGRTVGRGGNGAAEGETGTNGGTAIFMQYPLTLINQGVVGGGGGGGGFTLDVQGSVTAKIPGSGGAGRLAGAAGGNIQITGEDSVTSANQPQQGGVLDGGAAGEIFYVSGGEGFIATGVTGGGLGENGTNSTTNGGAAGSAIVTNGNTLTQEAAGDIRGAVV